eukprot:SAG31_NODE_19755_length_592_cov_1.125761_1_plen_72_part_00
MLDCLLGRRENRRTTKRERQAAVERAAALRDSARVTAEQMVQERFETVTARVEAAMVVADNEFKNAEVCPI